MNVKQLVALGLLSLTAGMTGLNASNTTENRNEMEKLTLTKEWDKTFPKSDKIDHSKVTFVNRYGITLAADMYKPKHSTCKLPAIAVCGPFGAVKEQAAGLYAQEMAERGFLTIAFDPSFTGESGGTPRYMTSPDINTEDFNAAVDYLVTNPEVDSEKVGILGICDWGGIAINAAACDPRIKATLASTMYDMSRVSSNGYFDAADSAEARNAIRKTLAHSVRKITATARRNRRVGYRMCFRRMPRSSCVTTMIITRQNAAIIPVHSIPMVAAMSQLQFPGLISRS